jgi:hypothetical protein
MIGFLVCGKIDWLLPYSNRRNHALAESGRRTRHGDNQKSNQTGKRTLHKEPRY